MQAKRGIRLVSNRRD